MAKSLGSSATLHVSNDGSSWTLVGNVTKTDPGIDTDLIDSTDNDDAGYKSKLPGDKQSKLAFSAMYNPNDAGQAIIMTNLGTKAATYFRYRSRGAGSGLPEMKAQYYMSGGYPPSEHEKMQTLDVKAESTGTVTETVQ